MLFIRRLTALPPQLPELEVEARKQGFNFITRLINDWTAEVNRFDKPGEKLLAVLEGERLVAIGGLNIDPHGSDEYLARLRRLYVLDEFRRRGVGEALVAALLEGASTHFRVIRLSTDTTAGAALYARLGFEETNDEHATHKKTL